MQPAAVYIVRHVQNVLRCCGWEETLGQSIKWEHTPDTCNKIAMSYIMNSVCVLVQKGTFSIITLQTNYDHLYLHNHTLPAWFM